MLGLRPLLVLILTVVLPVGVPARELGNTCAKGTKCTCHKTAHECYLDTQCVHARDQATGEVTCVEIEANSKIKGCWYGGCEGAIPIEGEEFW